MWNTKFLASLFCIVTLAFNQAITTLIPCCCLQPIHRSPCCHSSTQYESPARLTRRSCCAKSLTKPASVSHRCGCSLKKGVPQPTKNTSIVRSHTTNIEALCWLSMPADIFTQSLISCISLFELPHSTSGPPLLALYCRWLN